MQFTSIEEYLSAGSGQNMAVEGTRIAHLMHFYDTATPDEIYDRLITEACGKEWGLRTARALYLISELAHNELPRGSAALGAVAVQAIDKIVQTSAISMIGQNKIESEIGTIMFIAATEESEIAACADAVLDRMLDRALADA